MLGTQASVNIVNVFWAKLTTSGTVTQGDLDTWTAAFGAAYKARFTAQFGTGYTFSQCKAVLFVDGTPLNVLESTASLTGSGSATSGTDLATAMTVSWNTSAYWRGGKPRTYLPVSGALSTTAKVWSTTAITAATTAVGNFRTDINALTGGTTITGTALGFVSFYSGGNLRSPPLFFSYQGFKIHPRYSHQRRRDGKWLV
jgi:hypothetical protein